MKKILKKPFMAMFFILLGSSLVLFSCRKDKGDEGGGGTPKITKVTKTEPNSIGKDSTFTESFPNRMILIHGENFDGVKAVYFNGQPAYFNRNYTTNTSIIISIPADAPTAATMPEAPNEIRVVTNGGEAKFTFKLLVDRPAIYAVSNEFAKPGSTITLYGKRMYVIEKVIFPGNIEATGFTLKGDSILTVQVPANVTTGGRLIIKNQFGADTAKFRDRTGLLTNFDDVNTYSWGATSVTENATDYPGTDGKAVINKFTNASAGDWSWWNGGRSWNLNAMQLLPVADLSKSINNFALKFEIFVKEPWSAGTVILLPRDNWTYVHMYRPWYIDATTTKAFSTTGWTTVTIPLNKFLTKKNGKDGTGDPAPNLAALLGGTGNGSFTAKIVNDMGAAIPKFDVAFDNLRIVNTKIK